MKFLKVVVSSFTLGVLLTSCGGSSDSPKEKFFTVSGVANKGGSLEIQQARVAQGSTTSLKIESDSGYHIKSINGCNGSLTGNNYTTGAISGDCTVKAEFELNTYSVTVKSTAGGRFVIENSAPQHGAASRVIALPDEGYGVEGFSGCGTGVADYSAYTTAPVIANCEVALAFKKVVPIEGVAAEGAALVGAEVTAKCEDGSTFISKVTTNDVGKFSGEVGEGAFPCALKVMTNAKTFFSIANQSGITNINLLTDMAVALASGKLGSEWYASKDWSNANNKLAEAQVLLKDYFYKLGYTLPVNFLPFTSTFALGDSWDKLLDQIQSGIEKTPGLTYGLVVDSLNRNDLNSIPSPTGGSEPTAEVCFNPVLYEEGAILKTLDKYTITSVDGNGETSYEDVEKVTEFINGKILIENDVPVLKQTATGTFKKPNYISYLTGEYKLFANLSEKIVGKISYNENETQIFSGLENDPHYYTFSQAFLKNGEKVNFSLKKNASESERFNFKTSYTVDGLVRSAESDVKNTKTFRGLRTTNHKGIDYRVCDFEIQRESTNGISFDNTPEADWEANYHEYYLVGGGVLLKIESFSIILNGEELLTGQPK